MTWLSWWLMASPKYLPLSESVPYELLRWAVPKTEQDSYPSLFLVTWPGHE